MAMRSCTESAMGASRAKRGIAGQNPPVPPSTKGGIEGGFADACGAIDYSQWRNERDLTQ